MFESIIDRESVRWNGSCRPCGESDTRHRQHGRGRQGCDNRPGKLSVGLGLGNSRGQGGAADGLGYTSEDLAWRANVSAATDFRGGWGVAKGASFTLN